MRKSVILMNYMASFPMHLTYFATLNNLFLGNMN